MSDVLVDRAEEIVPLLVKYLTRTAAIPLTLNHTVPLEHRLDAAARGYDVEEDLCVSGTWDLDGSNSGSHDPAGAKARRTQERLKAIGTLRAVARAFRAALNYDVRDLTLLTHWSTPARKATVQGAFVDVTSARRRGRSPHRSPPADAADRFRTCEVLSVYATPNTDAVPDAVRALPNLRALSLGPTVRTPTWLAGFSRLVEFELARPIGEMPPLPATLRIIRHGDGPPDLDHVRGLPHLAELDIGDHRWRPCPMWLDELRLRAFAATNVSIPAFAEALRGMPLLRLKFFRAVPPPQSGLEGDAMENNRALDRALADPRALRALDLQGYPLAPFPEAVRGLVQLRELTLRDAGLQGLPAWLADLRALVLLVVAGNADVVSLPPAIAAITTLRILDLGTETCGQVGFSWLSSWLAQERPDLHIFEDFYYH